MMLGGGQQYEKYIRLQKSKIYKKILDAQIQRDQLYKQQQKKNVSFTSNQDESEIYPVHLQSRKQKSMTESIIHQIAKSKAKQKKNRKIYFPIIEDKNTHFQGSSKFLKLDQAQSSKSKVKEQKKYQLRIKTQETIPTTIDQEEYLGINESYMTTCENIISDLKQLNEGLYAKKRKRIKPMRYNFDSSNNTEHIADHEREIERNRRITQTPVARSHNVSAFSESQFQPQPRQYSIKNTIAQQSTKDIVWKPKVTKQHQVQAFTPNLIKSESQQNHTNRKTSQQIKMEQEIVKKKQNFITILKKVRSRGENLYEKLSKLSFSKALKSDE